MDYSTLGFSLLFAALGIVIDRCIINNQKGSWVVCIVLLVLSPLCFSLAGEKQEEISAAKLDAIETYYNEGQHLDAIELLISTGFEDATSCMIYGHYLMNGLGVNQDIDRGIEYYNKAIRKGEKKAESNLVAAITKNCQDARKIPVIKQAYENENEMAVAIIEYAISLNEQRELSADQVWDLSENEILHLLNEIVYNWIKTTVSSPTRLSPQSLQDFTRRYLYGYYVYEESVRVKRELPDWLIEDLWE